MSIESWIDGLVACGRLHQVRPWLPGQSIERRIFATQEVNELVCGPWPHVAAERRCGSLRADFDAFVSGEEIGVCTIPRRARNARMGLLSPASDGIWDFRSQSPRPGIRVVGKFAAQDAFVALVPAARSQACDYIARGPLGDADSDEWKALITEAKRLWNSLMPMWPGITGDHIDDYFRTKYYHI